MVFESPLHTLLPLIMQIYNALPYQKKAMIFKAERYRTGTKGSTFIYYIS